MWMCQDADVNLPTLENGKQEHDVSIYSIYIYTVHVVSLSSPCIPMLKLTETLVLLLKGEGIAAAWRILIDILSWCMYLWEALGANLGGR